MLWLSMSPGGDLTDCNAIVDLSKYIRQTRDASCSASANMWLPWSEGAKADVTLCTKRCKGKQKCSTVALGKPLCCSEQPASMENK